MSAAGDFEIGLALRAVNNTIGLMEEAVADADGPEVASLLKLLKCEVAELDVAIEEAE